MSEIAPKRPIVVIEGSNIGASDGVWVDQGSEISTQGYKVMRVWVDLTVSDSTGNQLQALLKHTSDGDEEYVLEAAADYQKTLGDADTNVCYIFELDDSVPFVQFQTRATDVDTGGGTIGTVGIKVTFGNK